eukprot:2204852-Rhodomonas_salina.2
MVLSAYATSGTDIAYGATRSSALRVARSFAQRMLLAPRCQIATRDPVLTCPIVPRTPYAMSGTNIGFVPRQIARAVWPKCAAAILYTRNGARRCALLSALLFDSADCCCYAICRTVYCGLCYAVCYAVCFLLLAMVFAMLYAMLSAVLSATPYAGPSAYARYAMSGTDAAYGATKKRVLEQCKPIFAGTSPITLRTRCAMSGTDTG